MIKDVEQTILDCANKQERWKGSLVPELNPYYVISVAALESQVMVPIY